MNRGCDCRDAVGVGQRGTTDGGGQVQVGGPYRCGARLRHGTLTGDAQVGHVDRTQRQGPRRRQHGIHADRVDAHRTGEIVDTVVQVDVQVAGHVGGTLGSHKADVTQAQIAFLNNTCRNSGFTRVAVSTLGRDLQIASHHVAGQIQAHGTVARVDTTQTDALATGIGRDDHILGRRIDDRLRLTGVSIRVEIVGRRQQRSANHLDGDDTDQADLARAQRCCATAEEVVRRVARNEGSALNIECSTHPQPSVGQGSTAIDIRPLGDIPAADEGEVVGHQRVVQGGAAGVGVLEADIAGSECGGVDAQIALQIDRRTGFLGQQTGHRDRDIGATAAIQARHLKRSRVDGANGHAVGVHKGQRSTTAQNGGQEIDIVAGIGQGHIAGRLDCQFRDFDRCPTRLGDHPSGFHPQGIQGHRTADGVVETDTARAVYLQAQRTSGKPVTINRPGQVQATTHVQADISGQDHRTGVALVGRGVDGAGGQTNRIGRDGQVAQFVDRADVTGQRHIAPVASVAGQHRQVVRRAVGGINVTFKADIAIACHRRGDGAAQRHIAAVGLSTCRGDRAGQRAVTCHRQRSRAVNGPVGVDGAGQDGVASQTDIARVILLTRGLDRSS